MFLRLLFVFVLLLPSPLLGRERLVVFAASSQTDAMNEIESTFEKQCGCDLVFSFAASSVLARQIDAGATADVFLSASADWVRWLEKRQNIGSGVAFIGNRLVIVANNAISSPSQILSEGRFSMADPRSVPAGVYAKEALSSLKLWNTVRPNAVFTENVRIALTLVARGDLNAGIVYQSDFQQFGSGDAVSKYLFPKDSHSSIEYLATQLNSRSLSEDFIAFLQSDAGQKILERLGFLPLSDKQSE